MNGTQPQYSEAQVKAAQRANTLGFVTQLMQTGLAKSASEATSLYKRANEIHAAAMRRQDAVRTAIKSHLAAAPAA